MHPQAAAIDTVGRGYQFLFDGMRYSMVKLEKLLGNHLGNITADIFQMLIIFRSPHFVTGNPSHIDEIPGYLALHGNTLVHVPDDAGG